MKTQALRNRIAEMSSHVLFTYRGVDGGVDPISPSHFDVWYGNTGIVAGSLEEVMNSPLFDGLALATIAPDIIMDEA